MTTDEAFKMADALLDRAIEIWENKAISEYDEARDCYNEAVRLRNEYFSDNKNILTEDLCPF